MAKPKITRIKANDTKSAEVEERAPIVRKRVALQDKKAQKATRKEAIEAKKKSRRAERKAKNKNAPLVLRPFVALGRYFKDAWHELRQVRWPNRKDTWKMVFAVIIYAVVVMSIILLLDLFFSWLFALILG